MLSELRELSKKRGGLKGSRASELLEELREATIEALVEPSELERAARWVAALEAAAKSAAAKLGASGWTLPRELKSFSENPRAHLRKKLFLYAFDAARGKLSLDDYLEKARAALTTSLKTNMRSVYQGWVFASLLEALAEEGAELVYPEHGVIPLDRSGKQRAGSIPPNAVLRIPARGELSFFVEAPRPIGWEDTSDLAKAWRLYVSLRPDVIVYSGRVLNALAPEGSDLPVLRPDAIVECKEQSDWYERSRDLRGPFAKPLTAEEWMSIWLSGLWAGLAEVLGVSGAPAEELREGKKKSLRVSEPQLVALYKRVFKPSRMFLVSLPALPERVRAELAELGVEVHDGVEIGEASRLKALASELAKLAGGSGSGFFDEVLARLRERGLRPARSELEEALKRLALEHFDELLELLRRSGGA